MTTTTAKPKSYEIDALSKGLQVLFALEGIGFEPVSVATIVGRTEFTKNFVFRSLKTLELHGLAVRVGGQWAIGKRMVRLAANIQRTQL